MTARDLFPYGPVTITLLVVTGIIFLACLVRGTNRIAVTAIFMGMFVHSLNRNVFHVEQLHLVADVLTAMIVISAFHGPDKVIQATFWAIVIAAQTVVLAGILSLFWGGIVTKLAILAATILCLPTGGGHRVRRRTVDTDFKPSLRNWGRPVNLGLRICADQIWRFARGRRAD